METENKEKKSKGWKILKAIFKGTKFILSIGFAVVAALVKSLTVDFFRNVKMYIMMSVSKEEREKIRIQLETKKRVELMEDKMKVMERLVYAVFKDPKYVEKKEGEYDLKQLAKHMNK